MADKITNILLLTNRDSDNVGDQLIEESVISLIKGVMGNLGFSESEYRINSKAAGIISKKYMKTEDPALLSGARKAISEADVVVFGGAPLFNYSYQTFYLRTIKTLELAEEYGVPVLFSSIGVEKFDSDNPKSVALQKALQLSCVRQITTRDDLDSVAKYLEGTQTPYSRVSDPAVLADQVFGPADKAKNAKKKIGLVVTRAEIFKANGISFNESQQRRFWLDVMSKLDSLGYDYKLFTTGHFTDEVFLDALVRAKGIPEKKTAINVNSPEELINEISSCDGIIAYRLHANIAAFAYEVPAIGLTWNFKVPFFYESIGYGDRALDSSQWNAETVVEALEKAMQDGVVKDEGFLMSVYESLFAGLKDVLDPGNPVAAYSFRELKQKLPVFQGTSPATYREKVNRKMRRSYESYQGLYTKNKKLARMKKVSFPRRVYRKLRREIKNMVN